MFPINWNFPFRKKDGSLTTMEDAISSGGGGGGYTLPTASASTKGGIKIGSGLTMEGEVLNNNNPNPYTLPTASSNTKGGVKVGSGLSIDENGVLSASGGGGGGTQLYYKDFNLAFSDWTRIGETIFYCGESSTDINIAGYTPASCVVWDLGTGYRALSSISRWGNTGNNYKVVVHASRVSASNAFSARIFYIKDTDLTPIPTTKVVKTTKSKK